MAKLPSPRLVPLEAEGLELELRGYENVGKPRVLMLHGASACHKTFLFPEHSDGLTGFLWNAGFEPWLLDWCGSNIVVDKRLGPGNWLSDRFDFDMAAKIDLPRAIEAVSSFTWTGDAGNTPQPVKRLLGFCMGGAVIAQSMAAGHLEDFGIDNIVLMAIGLFYESTGEGKLKVQDHILERVMTQAGPDNRCIDPRCHPGTTSLRHRWPESFENLYKLWPENFQPHDRHHVDQSADTSHILEQCNRVTFMFGQPYTEQQLVPELHKSSKELQRQFGGIALRMYAQAARNTRRGWAAEWKSKNEGALLEDTAREHFDILKRITLVTGNNNRIWHRDSIDRMYEWLLKGPRRDPARVEKQVFHDHGHQDLLWGSNSGQEIYPYIAQRLA